MNREGAETYLRVLAEAEMRGPAMPAPSPSSAPGGTVTMAVVAQALTAVCVLDPETATAIMADFDLAVRLRHGQVALSTGPAGGTGTARPRPTLRRFPGPGPATPSARLMRSWRWPGGPGGPGGPGTPAAGTGSTGGQPGGPGGPRSPGPPGHDQPGQSQPDRFVPVGLTVPFGGEGFGGEMFLLSYAHTGSGARFTMAWRLLTTHLTTVAHPGVQVSRLQVTDDRGGRYQLSFAGSGGPGWNGQVGLYPEPPHDIRWLDIAMPGEEAAVRVTLDLARAGAGSTGGGFPAGTGPAVTLSQRPGSPGEHLLTRLAERLLTTAPEIPPDLRQQLAAMSSGPFDGIFTGLGAVIAALEAAEVLSPLSPVPGRLAALCASLGITGHGITVPPAPDLPEPWLSLLAHYRRRKPDAAAVRDGCAAVAAALPELDGVRLAVLGLQNTEGETWLQVLARGLMPEGHHGPFGLDMYFPLSVWIRDSGGRWHATRASGWHRAGGEYALKLQLVPPLPRTTTWIDIAAAGPSAQARARLPLRWEDPS
jgi:hypothetical protein